MPPSTSDKSSLTPASTTSSSTSSSATPSKITRLQIHDFDSINVDEILNNDLKQLSVQDRNSIQEEIHGVHNPCPYETPQLISTSIQSLNVAISLIPNKSGYDEAQTLYGTYVNTIDFQLRFLRAELFNPIKAAIRLVKFCDLIKRYYGIVGLQRPIQISDLGYEEVECLKSGKHQVLPFRDRSGRRVGVAVADWGLQYSIEVRCKMLIYIFWATTDDIETQRNGIVFINWPDINANNGTSKFLLPEKKEHVLGSEVREAMPMRICCVHLCLPNDTLYRILKVNIALILGKELRSRLKFALGSRTEIWYHLQSYGIPIQYWPVTETGNVKTAILQQWMKYRTTIESMRNHHAATNNTATTTTNTTIIDNQIIECPGRNDVTFRPGKSYLFHPGNSYFRSLLEEKSNEHHNAPTKEKKIAITWYIIEQVTKNRNGRFLQWNSEGGWWEPMEDQVQLRTKVAVCFREYKKQVRARENCQINNSSTHKFQRQDVAKRKRNDGETELNNCFLKN